MTENVAKKLVKELEKLESKVKIVQISADGDNLHFLQNYVSKHANGEDPAKGNFNEYLQARWQEVVQQNELQRQQYAQRLQNELQQDQLKLETFQKQETQDISAKTEIPQELAQYAPQVSQRKREGEQIKMRELQAKIEEAQKRLGQIKSGQDVELEGGQVLQKLGELGQDSVVIAEIRGQIGLDTEHQYSQHDRENIDVAGADLSGSRLVDNDIFGSLKDVTLRDCFFEEVTFQGCDLFGVDFRGTKLKNCTFHRYEKDRYGHDPRLDALHLDCHDAEVVKLLGAEIESDSISKEDAKSRTKRANNEQCEVEVKAFEADKRNQQSRAIWLKSFIVTPREFEAEIEVGKKEIQLKYQEQLAKEFASIDEEYRITPSHIQADPTYIPKDKKRAEAKKVLLKATQQELEAYIALVENRQLFPDTEEDLPSFNEFIAQKEENQRILAEAKEGGRETIPVADFSPLPEEELTLSDLDLSRLDLSGVNFANVQFNNCKFDNAELTGSCFESAKFKGNTSFEGATLTDSNFIGASGEGTHFNGAFMPRIRMMYSNFKNSNFEEALLYSADLTGSNIEGAVLKRADARHADFEKVNMRYVDAQYVKMRKAHLKGAILDGGDFSHADLTNAVMCGIRAEKANFTEAVLENAKLEYANLREAILNEIKAKGADLTEADLEQAQLKSADLSNVILDKVNAQLANFTEAILNDAQAQQADFSNAVMEKIKGERLDISKAILNETNLRNVNLTNAVMKEVGAYKADFRETVLQSVNAQNSKMIACDFRKAKAQKIDIIGSTLLMCYVGEANFEGTQYDEAKTLVLGTDFVNAIGAEELATLQETQQEHYKGLFGKSKYDPCKSPEDSIDRFRCQKLGASILSSVATAGPAYVLSGPFAGMAGAVVGGIAGDYALEAIKERNFKDRRYIDNALGDELAKLGAIAIATGAGSLEAGVNSIPAAAALCAATGLISPQSIGLVAGGAIATCFGVKELADGFVEQSTVKKIVGATLTVLGAGATAVGLNTIAHGINLFTGTVLCGAAWGGIRAGVFAHNQLTSYDKFGKICMKPEEIYQMSVQKGKDVFKKIWPTWNKLTCASVYGIVGAVVGLVFAHHVFIAMELSALVYATFTMNIGGAGAALGATSGYLFDENLSFWQKFSIQGIKDYIRDKTDVLVEKEQEPVTAIEVQKLVEIEKQTTLDKDKQEQKSTVLQEKEGTKKNYVAEPVTTEKKEYKKHKRHIKYSHATKHKQQTGHREKHGAKSSCPVKKVLQNGGRQGQSKAESERREKAVTGVSHPKLG